MQIFNRNLFAATALLIVILGCDFCIADEFIYVDEAGDRITTQARLIGTRQGFSALERWDGQVQIVPTSAIVDRKPTGDPDPIDVAGMKDVMGKLFGEEKVRFQETAHSLVVLVLDGELDKTGESRSRLFLKQAGTFNQNIENIFMRYAKQMRFPLRDLRYPLVLIIFESDAAFEDYTQLATGNQGLSATNILGFYSNLTNWLAVRMSSCDTFEVPLHEAIHQHMYNRVFQRLSAVPKWFDEGIATGFESDGKTIRVSPQMVNSRYARQTLQIADSVDWKVLVANDVAFTTDILAGEAYTSAWCMHWMLVSTQKEEYQKFVQHLASLEPLQILTPEERITAFEAAFGTEIATLQGGSTEALRQGVRRQKVNLNDPRTPGFAEFSQSLGIAQIRAVQNGVSTRVDGKLKNGSPLRNMTFLVVYESDGGEIAHWVVADIAPGKSAPLNVQTPRRVNGSFGGGNRFSIRILSAPAESKTAEEWNAGRIPQE
ncbi:MAG: DUF1570 domain-containing protein [Planctomycetaceae bacterium]|nr:DUF1570 domain-containing protein [Planctomycetaceae bacterium]MCB9951052.1 DUF1570 domain-containing protein [Planctomycetaceae bacterium]